MIHGWQATLNIGKIFSKFDKCVADYYNDDADGDEVKAGFDTWMQNPLAMTRKATNKHFIFLRQHVNIYIA